MKPITFITVLLLSLLSSAQNPVGALESTELTILYRGYPNKITPAITQNNGKKVAILCDNATIEKAENFDYFFVKPGTGKTATLHLVLLDGKQVDTIKSTEYRLMNLPEAEIYWGSIKQGNLANVKAAKFFVKYPPEVPLSCNFEVVSWQTTYQGTTISGEGPNLKAAEELFKSIKAHTTLQFQIVVKSPDGIQRIRSAQWEVTPWEEAGDPTPDSIKCEG